MLLSYIKFSQLIFKKMYRDQFGEFACGILGLKGIKNFHTA